MRRWGLPGLVGIVCLASANARQLPVSCGTHPLRLQEEMFLHRQSMRKNPGAHKFAPRAASAAQDIGNIAVLDASGGVVITRNQFDLDHRTLTFLPTSAVTGDRKSVV